MKNIFTWLILFVLPLAVFAQSANIVTVKTDTVEFVMGSGFTAEEAYTRVLARAKRLAVDLAAETYIQTYTETRNYVLTQDIVEAVQVGTIREFSILWHNDVPEEEGTQRIVLRALVECPSIDELRKAVEDLLPGDVEVKNGQLYVSSYPDGASIFIDGDKQMHSTPYTFLDIPEGKHDVTLRLSGYRPKTLNVEVSLDDPQLINVLLQRPKGQIKITSNLKDATVRIDNEYYGTVPVTSKEIPIGIHDITVTGPDEWEPYTAEVEVYNDRVISVHADLRKRRGRLLVFVEPSDVQITIFELTKTISVKEHHTFRDLEPMKYTLKAEKKGYKFEGKSVELPPGKTVQVEFFGTKIRDLAATTKVKKKKGKKTWWYVGGTAVVAGAAYYYYQSQPDDDKQGNLQLIVPKR